MSLKKDICSAFCHDVEVSHFNGGIAVSMPYSNYLGEKVGLYVIGPEGGPYRIIDNALTVSFLEAEGASLDSATRRSAFEGLLEIYGAAYDYDLGEVYIDHVDHDRLPKSILDFSALLLRLNDMLMLTQEHVANTFKEDVRAALRAELDGKAIILEDEPVSAGLAEIVPDMVFKAQNREPVALFLANSESKLWQAIHLQMIANYEARTPVSVVAMLENERIGSQKLRTQADNRLDAVPRYQGAQRDAIHRVVVEVLGKPASVH
ncbi:hypothetical protein ACVII0_002714 [Sinorhizobium meliloti]|uniref:DUF1828 domain-containing protein n=1 Tax=Rhizobium meliloti TaxID=382 RepID=UPI000FD92450|nr:DUF1828 domain-containing protein [Sinorhizobium meliloti]RVH20431.1 DUF1828 domain-containing protein [Sinorhizobium meliloti]